VERQFIRFNAGSQGGIVRVFDATQFVEPVDELEVDLLLGGCQVAARLAEVERVGGVDANRDGVVLGAEGSGRPWRSNTRACPSK